MKTGGGASSEASATSPGTTTTATPRLPIAVRMAWQAARAVRIPVIGIGGISSAEDALEFLIAGCRAVQIGTANFVDPGIYDRVLEGLSGYLRRHELTEIGQLVGTLEYPGDEKSCSPGGAS